MLNIEDWQAACDAYRSLAEAEATYRQSAEARALALEGKLDDCKAQLARAEAALVKLSARCAELDQLVKSQAESLSIAIRLKEQAEGT